MKNAVQLPLRRITVTILAIINRGDASRTRKVRICDGEFTKG